MLRERLFIFGLIAACAIAVSLGAPGSPFFSHRLASSAASGPATVEPTGAPSPTPVAQIQPSAAPRTTPTSRRSVPAAPARPATPAPLPSGVMSRQQQLTNQARAQSGLPALAWSTCLAGVAASHASDMANAGYIYHGDGVQRDLACGPGTSRSGENVGRTSDGQDDQLIFDAFMNSPGHRANILGQYRFIGTAWVIASDGTGYVSVEFAG